MTPPFVYEQEFSKLEEDWETKAKEAADAASNFGLESVSSDKTGNPHVRVVRVSTDSAMTASWFAMREEAFKRVE
jgi:hypothetical protein